MPILINSGATFLREQMNVILMNSPTILSKTKNKHLLNLAVSPPTLYLLWLSMKKKKWISYGDKKGVFFSWWTCIDYTRFKNITKLRKSILIISVLLYNKKIVSTYTFFEELFQFFKFYILIFFEFYNNILKYFQNMRLEKKVYNYYNHIFI